MLILLRNIIVVFGVLLFAVNSYAHTDKHLRTKANSQKITALSEIKVVNINTADIRTLKAIKGIGDKKAKAIVAYRQKKALFKSIDDLLKIKCRGVNKKWLNKVSKFLTI